MKPAAQRVQVTLEGLGLDRRVLQLAVDARTSQQAADAVGVGVGQIVKSLVFTRDGRPILVLASGVNRVDEAKLGEVAGGRIARADADTVRAATGYAIGGVPPVGHATALDTYIDEDLLGHELLYAAGGVPECVFPLSPAELVRITGGRVVDVKQAADQPRKGATG
jgi:prolyl-tRNA editing enzyme YbaK/EbsC (Cys-tRNA(Pro) deacylase)